MAVSRCSSDIAILLTLDAEPGARSNFGVLFRRLPLMGASVTFRRWRGAGPASIGRVVATQFGFEFVVLIDPCFGDDKAGGDVAAHSILQGRVAGFVPEAARNDS